MAFGACKLEAEFNGRIVTIAKGGCQIEINLSSSIKDVGKRSGLCDEILSSGAIDPCSVIHESMEVAGTDTETIRGSAPLVNEGKWKVPCLATTTVLSRSSSDSRTIGSFTSKYIPAPGTTDGHCRKLAAIQASVENLITGLHTIPVAQPATIQSHSTKPFDIVFADKQVEMKAGECTLSVFLKFPVPWGKEVRKNIKESIIGNGNIKPCLDESVDVTAIVDPKFVSIMRAESLECKFDGNNFAVIPGQAGRGSHEVRRNRPEDKIKCEKAQTLQKLISDIVEQARAKPKHTA